MYPIRSVKQDPVSKNYAVKTGMTDPQKSWCVLLISDGSTNFVADEDVTDWADIHNPEGGGE